MYITIAKHIYCSGGIFAHGVHFKEIIALEIIGFSLDHQPITFLILQGDDSLCKIDVFVRSGNFPVLPINGFISRASANHVLKKIHSSLYLDDDD